MRLALCAILLAAIGVAANSPKQPSLADLAPSADFIQRNGYFAGRPDRSGVTPWVLERIDKLDGPGNRNDSSWHASPDALPERHARNTDYEGSGKSKGHMRPAADAHASQEQMDDTHDLLNAVPQCQEFNRLSWEKLEVYARDLRKNGATVYAITGPAWLPQSRTHKDGHQTAQIIVNLIGPDDLWCPTHLWKSLLIEDENGLRIESYLATNSDLAAHDDIQTWRLPTDELEGKIGADLWRGLPVKVQAQLESVQ